MFEIGFSELLMIMVVGVVVIGPQQLPEVVRSSVLFIRRVKRFAFEAQDTVERELDLYHLKQDLHDEDMERHIRELNQSIMDLDKNDWDNLPDHDPLEHEQSTLAQSDDLADTGIEPTHNHEANHGRPQS